MPTSTCLGLLALCVLIPAMDAQPVLANGSFETPNIGPCPNLAFPGQAGWIFTNSAGITSTGCGQRFAIVPPPPGGGVQAGFLQAGPEVNEVVLPYTSAAISQTVSGFQAGHAYNISFYAAGHAYGVNCDDNCTELNFSVFVGSSDLLDVISPPVGYYQQYTTPTFTATGSATITFYGSAALGIDAVSFIDLVSINDLGEASSKLASVSGAVSASAFGEFLSASPGSWVEIYGSNLASDTRSWSGSDFKGNNAPTSLDGVSVSVAGQAAFIDYISPGQVNALLSSNTPTGLQQLTVISPAGTASYSITINPTQPGLLAPGNFKIGNTQYVVAIFPDGTYALPPGTLQGITSRAAKPGDVVTLYGVGFGPVTPASPAGQLVQEPNTLASSFDLSIGGTPATLQYDGLAPTYTGLYQFNILIPNTSSGNAPLTFTLGGTKAIQTLYLPVSN